MVERVRYCATILLPAALLAGTLFIFSAEFGAVLAQLFNWLIPLLYDRVDHFHVGLVLQNSEWVYLLKANNSTPILIGLTLLPANSGLSSSTLLAHSFQHLLFFIPVVVGGACYHRCSPMRLWLLSLLLLLLLEVIDIPFVLIGSIEDLLLFNVAPIAHAESLWIKWLAFLSNGGRIGLAMIAAWFVVIASQRNLVYKWTV